FRDQRKQLRDQLQCAEQEWYIAFGVQPDEKLILVSSHHLNPIDHGQPFQVTLYLFIGCKVTYLTYADNDGIRTALAGRNSIETGEIISHCVDGLDKQIGTSGTLHLELLRGGAMQQQPLRVPYPTLLTITPDQDSVGLVAL